MPGKEPTPLMLAIWKDDLKSVNKLLKKRANPDEVSTGMTPAMEASMKGKDEILKALLAAGADPNLQDSRGWAALHFAAQDFQTGAVRILLEGGATVDLPDGNGNTPLSTAVFNSRERGEIIKLLLDAGADRNRENEHGVSPLGLAGTIGNYDVKPFFG